ncbi:MAG TPA: LytR C-terminal domain-containing protein [Gemmatimonadales bacterium]|nr:LytR C-terminal domain-containing protein [Gemmatimonadales bacterium]
MELTPGARRGLIAAGALLFLVVLVLGVRALRRDQVEGHAFAIPSTDDALQVEVLNGSGRTGLARLGARRLRRQGIDVVLFGNATEGPTDSTRIILRRGDRARAERVRGALGLGKLEVALDSLRRVDVTVLLGPDFQPDEDGRP